MAKSLDKITYEQDFYAWLLESAQLIRQGQFAKVDVENVAEELEGMAKSDRRQLINRFAVLLAHLLKWQYQPEKRSKSWERTIKEQRKRIQLLLEESPSLQYEISAKIADAYEIAILSAANETNLDESVFPESCEFAVDEILDSNFYPD
jgi:Domain of unknown function DUF29